MKYEIVIGLEVHCQLATESKIFASDTNKFGSEPNTNISVITLGHPGVLPKLNKKAVEFAIRMGLACGCEINRNNYFDRKNYFYPDLPKGYQVSQDKYPICKDGEVKIRLKDGKGFRERTLELHHIHLEEDAGKSVHDGSDAFTLLDYNRAGTPLVEIVSEPCMRSPEEAATFLTEIRKIVRYLGICDGNMEEGSMRADLNVSIREEGTTEFGTKVEIKNMNSIRNLQHAAEFEYKRQIALLESGGKVIQETRMFDADNGQTYSMRLKETMNDYRYFPDPDLSPVVISEQWLSEITDGMPALPQVLREKFTSVYGVPVYDALVLTDTKEMAEYFEAVCAKTSAYKAASNWLMGSVKSYLNEHDGNIESFPISAQILAELIELTETNLISNSVATQKIFPILLGEPERSPKEIATTNNWLQNSNTNELESLVDEVIASMPDKVAAYRKGKKGLLGLFVGEIMKKSNGAADPKMVNQLLTEKL